MYLVPLVPISSKFRKLSKPEPSAALESVILRTLADTACSMESFWILTGDDQPQISQAIVASGFVFCSGTVGIDPQTGKIAEGIEAQTELALRNLSAILEAAGSSLANVVKTTILYTDVDDFARLNEVYARFMPDPPPARSAPANVRLPAGLLISIEVTAQLSS